MEHKIMERKDLSFYREYTKHPDLSKARLQVLCANCNLIKRHELYKSPLYNIMGT